MKRAVVLIALLGCSNGGDPEPKPKPTPALALDARVADAAPKPAATVTLTPLDRAATMPVTATALVVVKSGGTATLIARQDTSEEIDLTALAAGTAVPLAELSEKVWDVQRNATKPCQRGASGSSTKTGGVPASDGWGSIGTGRYYTSSGHGRVRAGLIGTRSVEACRHQIPLVIADVRAPAAKLVEVLTALDQADLAVTTDGGTHARVLPITIVYTHGNSPPEPDILELGFTLRADGVRGSAYKGATADESTWTWTGEIAGLGDAYHQGQAVDALLGTKGVRLRLDGDVTAGALITAIANLLAGNVEHVAIGEPTDAVFGSAPGGTGRGPVPSVQLGQVQIDGAYDKAIVRRYIKRDLTKLKYCYEKQLLAEPALEGMVEAAFTIAANGQVTTASASGVHREVTDCMTGFLQAIEFPPSKSKDGRPSHVTYTFTFRPSGG